MRGAGGLVTEHWFSGGTDIWCHINHSVHLSRHVSVRPDCGSGTRCRRFGLVPEFSSRPGRLVEPWNL